ncbi:uncharacterized protein LOC111630817 [Centruroides sculpturatus]|uniref:uncharacterized protein LOC111630817 n=1 Tax=Centruroides sculpturatus TaxID=218467 RepID=UPI000C6E35F4|nr:uncharacterized protein LOC111630817 [Centruroides sculpturatus]
MNNQSIKIKKSIKYLGIWFDFRLSWDEHIKYIAKRTSLIFHAFSQIAKKTWGLNTDAISIIYDHIYIPIVTYACCSWGAAVNKVHLHRKLISSQRKALLLITKAYRTAPNSSLQVIARKPPITEVIKLECNLWNLRLGTDIITSTHHFQANKYEHPSPSNDSIPPYITNYIGTTSFPHPNLEIYTDGSGLNDGVGCAFVTYQSETEIYSQMNRLDCVCSVLQAELMAINLAISWTEENYNHNNIHIISDSAST